MTGNFQLSILNCSRPRRNQPAEAKHPAEEIALEEVACQGGAAFLPHIKLIILNPQLSIVNCQLKTHSLRISLALARGMSPRSSCTKRSFRSSSFMPSTSSRRVLWLW